MTHFQGEFGDTLVRVEGRRQDKVKFTLVFNVGVQLRGWVINAPEAAMWKGVWIK